MKTAEALRNNSECLTAWAAVKSYAQSKFPDAPKHIAYSIMFVADWLELQDKKEKEEPLKAFTDGYWKGERGINCVPVGQYLAKLPDSHWSKTDTDRISEEEIQNFIKKHPILDRLFHFINGFEQGDWLGQLENYHVWNKIRKSPYEIVSLIEITKGQVVELLSEFSRAHLENPHKPIPSEGAALVLLEQEKEKLKEEQLNNFERRSKSYGIPFQIESGSENLRAEKAWCSIQRYCQTRNLPDDDDLAYKIMFMADCRLLDATRPLKHENESSQTFTTGEWNFSLERGVPQPLVFVTHFSTYSNSWDITEISKFSDMELDEFEEEHGVLRELYNFVDSLSISEFESFLDDVPVWRSSSASTYRSTNLRFSALGMANLITLPSEISDITKKVKISEPRVNFEGAAKILEFPVSTAFSSSDEKTPKRAGGQPYTP